MRGNEVNVEHLREFAYLAETLSFSITAKHFFISQSVLSKHIMFLEDRLGVSLFDRDRRHVELTDMGRMFYKDCLIVLNDYDSALEHIASAKNDGSTVLKVGYLRNAAKPFLSDLIRYMGDTYPHTEFAITCMEYGELIRAHRSHELDAIITLDLDPEAVDLCDFGHIYDDKLYAVVGASNPLSEKTEGVSVKDLEGITVFYPNPIAYPGLYEFTTRIVDPGSVGMAKMYNDIDTLFVMLQSCDGVAFSSGHNIKGNADALAFLPIVDADTKYSISGRWLKTLDFSKAFVLEDAMNHCHSLMTKWKDDHLTS